MRDWLKVGKAPEKYYTTKKNLKCYKLIEINLTSLFQRVDMIYTVIPNLVKTVHLSLGYMHSFHFLLRCLRSQLRMVIVATGPEAQPIIG